MSKKKKIKSKSVVNIVNEQQYIDIPSNSIIEFSDNSIYSHERDKTYNGYIHRYICLSN